MQQGRPTDETTHDTHDMSRPGTGGDPVTSWRDVALVGSLTAVVISALLLVLMLVRGRAELEYTAGILLFPLTTGVTTVVALAVFERQVRRRRLAVAGVLAAAATVPGIALTTALFAIGVDHPLGTGSRWWVGLMIVGYAVLARVVSAVVPQPPSPDRPLTDEDWLRQTAGVLRLEHAMPESRVREVLARARAHAEESGHPLVDELGTPVAYARRLGTDRAARARRRAWWHSFVAAGAVLLVGIHLADEGWSGSAMDWLLVLAAVALVAAAGLAWRGSAARR